MNAIVVCLCGKRNKLRNCRSKKCTCGVVLSIRNGDIPYATYPESSLTERKKKHKVINDTVTGWWER